jgi:hypothetical protein
LIAINLTINAGWLSKLIPDTEDDADRALAESMNKMAHAFEYVIYFFGIYMILMSMIAFCCCSVTSSHRNFCCITIYELFMLILIISTTFIAIAPLAIYAIPEEDIIWFCESGRRAIEEEYMGSESHVDSLLELKDYVTEIDDYLALRTEVICTDLCPCPIEDYTPWESQFSDFDVTKYSQTGPTTDW